MANMTVSAIIREDRTSGLIRIIFNLSAQSSNAKSINDNLCAGTVVQTDVVVKIIRFRMHQVLFSWWRWTEVSPNPNR